MGEHPIMCSQPVLISPWMRKKRMDALFLQWQINGIIIIQ